MSRDSTVYDLGSKLDYQLAGGDVRRTAPAHIHGVRSANETAPIRPTTSGDEWDRAMVVLRGWYADVSDSFEIYKQSARKRDINNYRLSFMTTMLSALISTAVFWSMRFSNDLTAPWRTAMAILSVLPGLLTAVQSRLNTDALWDRAHQAEILKYKIQITLTIPPSGEKPEDVLDRYCREIEHLKFQSGSRR